MLDVWKKLKKHLIPKWWVFYGDESHGTPPNDATGPTPSIATTWGAAKQSPYKSDMVLDGLTGSWYNTVVLWRSHNVYIYIYIYKYLLSYLYIGMRVTPGCKSSERRMTNCISCLGEGRHPGIYTLHLQRSMFSSILSFSWKKCCK